MKSNRKLHIKRKESGRRVEAVRTNPLDSFISSQSNAVCNFLSCCTISSTLWENWGGGQKKKRKENQIKIRFSLLYSIRSHSWLSVCRPSSVQFANHWKPFFFLSFFSLQIAKLSSKNVEKSLEVVFSHFLTCFNSHFFSFEVKEL
jgi:hypothetical protein